MDKNIEEIIVDIMGMAHMSKLTYPSKQHCENDAKLQALLEKGFYIVGDNSQIVDQDVYEVYITINCSTLAELLCLDVHEEVHPGDYIRYEYKNELGKVKRLNPHKENCVFAWFHTGDTAACIDDSLFSVVLTSKMAAVMSAEDIKKYLHAYQFQNDYAVDALVDRKPE